MATGPRSRSANSAAGVSPPPEPAVGDPVVPRGRGLLLMSAFSDVRVEPGANGTTVTLRVPRERAGSATPADDGRLETLASTG
jgi:hypothetical protein